MECHDAMKNSTLNVQTDIKIDIKNTVLNGKKKELRSVIQYHLCKLETHSQANQHYIFNKDRHTYSRCIYHISSASECRLVSVRE